MEWLDLLIKCHYNIELQDFVLMDNRTVIEKIREYLEKKENSGMNLISYQSHIDQNTTLIESNIKIGLSSFKEIILAEETGLELGGLNKKSFSMVVPIRNKDLINHGQVTLLGKEVNKITESSIDFGIIIFIEIDADDKVKENELNQLTFISNGIEGFSIRTIPRRFWCRISKSAIQKGFSFEFLGGAIVKLCKQKFKDLVKSVEILLISSYPSSIDKIVTLTSDITSKNKEKWKKKIDEWRKRIDCEYDWGCEICPNREECYDVKQVLVSREEM